MGPFAEQVDRLWTIAEEIARESSTEEDGSDVNPGDAVWDERVSERGHKLADDARIATFERVGDNARALGILERRLAAGG
jgi:hypothetical protein